MPPRVNPVHLVLCLTPHIGPRTFDRVLRECKLRGLDPSRLVGMDEGRLKEEFGLRPQAARSLSSGAVEPKRRADTFLRMSEGKAVRLLTRDSPLYPKLLEEFCPSPPGYLFLYGNERLLRNPTFCVIASRDAAQKDVARAARVVEEQLLAGKTLVTGSDTQSYRSAAMVPLRWGAPRIVVLDRGLVEALGENLDEELFPAARVWRQRFEPDTDLAISFGRPDEGASPGALARRDEIVVGLAQEVYAIKLRKGGNMERFAARAEQCGRQVLHCDEPPRGSAL